MPRKRSPRAKQSQREPASEEELQGPPPQEATIQRSDAERQVVSEREQYHATSPKLSGGDPDADWQRADTVGEEAVGGTVATPDQNVVDELGEALGVSQQPADEVRSSAEILEERDSRRGREEGGRGRTRTKS
jgi:hypothetical protein